MGIENFISVSHTEGPKLVAQLEQHVKEYGVDIMNLQKAVALKPSATPGGYHEITLENGASLKSRTIILSTGARWRQMRSDGPADLGPADLGPRGLGPPPTQRNRDGVVSPRAPKTAPHLGKTL